MATGRYSRLDGRKSSGNGSMVTAVVFVVLCLAGIWMMTSSSLVNNFQDSKVSQESKNELTTQEDESHVENNSNAQAKENSNVATEYNNVEGNEYGNLAMEDNDAKGNESNNIAMEDISAKVNENGNVVTEANNAKGKENSNVAMEYNAKENEGKQKQFEDSQGDLPEDAIRADNNDRSNQVEKNDNEPEGMGKSSDKSEDKMKGDGLVENKEEKMQGASLNEGGKKVDAEPQVENKDSGPGEAAQNSFDGEKKSDKNSGKTDVKKQGDQVDNKHDDNEKRSKENSGNADVGKPEGWVEEKLDNENDGSAKKSEANSDNAEVKTQQDQVDEKVENKKDDNEKGSEDNSGKTEGRAEEKLDDKKDDSEKKSQGNSGKIDIEKQEVDNKKDDSAETSKENAGKTDLEKKADSVEKDENNKDVDNEKISADNPGNTNVTKQEDQKKEKPTDQGSTEKKDQPTEVLPSGAQLELLKELKTQNGSFSTQANMSKNKKEAQKSSASENDKNTYNRKLCKTNAGPDYIPCLDNIAAISKLITTKHYEHRERHCPENPPTCLVPIPKGYQRPIEWPNSRNKIWYHNVLHTKLAEYEGQQNWVKVSGEFLVFPGGDTQFTGGALHYIDFIQESVPDIAWGKRSRVVLDVGCGVASFGGFLFDRGALTMSLAVNDEHEAQVQFALERGIPAIPAVMGTMRLPYPGRVFDVVHCAHCRVAWHIEGGKLLLEVNRLLRPGGFFIWSATPVYQKLPEDVKIWEAMKKLTEAMCWEVVSIIRDKINKVGIAVYRKPTSNECYEKRPQNDPSLCPDSDDPNAAWNVPLKACMHKLPVAQTERGSNWPEQWPARVEKAPYWLLSTEVGVYGKPAPEDFVVDYKHWKHVVNNSYLNGYGIKWSTVRNAMDMRAVYGGLAAALKELDIWVMNVIPIDAPDTLPIIYERGLFGIYHDWCQSFSTYPRSYDLLHADHLFSKIKKKCNFMALVAETDRILRPEGNIIIRDDAEAVAELETIFKSFQWNVRMVYSNNRQRMIVAKKTMWRPTEEEILTYAMS